MPRNRIARDDVILSLAIQKPRSLNALGMVRGLNDRQKTGRTANKILAAISDWIAVPIDECPKVLKTRKNKGKSRPTSDLLKVLLKLKCEEHSVAQKLIASSDEIDELARNDGAKIRALNGRRRAIFGEDALALKHGKIAVTMKNDKYKIINI